MFSTNIDQATDETFTSFLNEYVDLDKWKQIFFKFVGGLSVTCPKMNVSRRSSFIKSSKWLRFKNAKFHPQNNNERCFKMFSA